MFRQAVLALAALAAFTSAQTNNSEAGCCAGGLNYTTSGPLEINATQIEEQTRASWCLAQRISCPEICGGQASNNSCSDTDLSYTCTCTNGNQPNISDYQQTIPFFVCEAWRGNCVANHPNDLLSQQACQSVVCGEKNASDVESSSSSSASSSATTTGAHSSSTGSHTSSGSASGTAATPSATSSGAAVMAMQVGQNYGTGILGAAVLALFGLAL